MHRRDVLALALIAVSGSAVSASKNPVAPLRLVTAHLPPLVMAPGEARPGALRELVDGICERQGITPNVAFMPWRRALFMATTMQRTAIFPLTRLPEREAQFRWLAPLYEENYIFLARHGSSFDVQRPQDMKNKRIALLRGAAQSAILAELGFRRLVEAASIDEVHRFLLAGMADAAFGERAIIDSSLRLHSQENDFHLGKPVRTTTAWLAGSLDIPDTEAQRYRTAMADLVEDGTKAKIFRQYGLA